MAYFICEGHRRAFRTYAAFSGHWMTKHSGEERPESGDVEVEELPEGMEVSEAARPRAARPSKSRESVSVEEAESGSGIDVSNLEELPKDPPELFYTLLLLKGVSEEKAKKLQIEFKLSKWMWTDPQEIMSLLSGAKLNVPQDWIRSFIKQYGNSVDLQPEAGLEFIGGRRSQPGRKFDFFGRPSDLEERESSADQLFRYLLWKETKGDKSDQVDSPLAARIAQIEKVFEVVTSQNQELIERLDRRDQEEREMAKEQERKKEIAKLEDRIEALTQSRSSEGSDWYQKYLQEKDSRQEERMAAIVADAGKREDRLLETIGSLSDRINQLSAEVKSTESSKETYARAAVEADRTKRQEIVEDLKSQGYSNRRKDTEERVLDIAETTIVPGVVREIQEGRKLIERVTKLGPPSGSQASTPVSPEEADRIAKIVNVESDLRSLGK